MSNFDDLGADLVKMFGSALERRNQKARYFSTGYKPLNKIICGSYDGGIPSGRIVEITGPSQSGKTHLATEIMISVQKQGGAAIFIDYERRFIPEFAARRGLVVTPPYFMYLTPPTWEEGNAKAIAIAEMIRESNAFAKDAPIVCVLDSVAAAVPRSMLDNGADPSKTRAKSLEFSMADSTALARATSLTLKLVAQFCDSLDLTFIYLNQVREKPGVVYGDNTSIPGGKAMAFYADVRLQLGKKMDKDGKDVIGQIVKAKALKAVTRPFQEVEWMLNFQDDGDTVVDRESSLIEYLIDNELIEQPSKGWITFGGNKMRKSALIEMAKKDPAVSDALNSLLKDEVEA